MNIRQIAPGLCYWTDPHPEWRGAADWPEDVGCVYYKTSDAVALIDPLIPRGEEEEFWALVVAEFFIGADSGLRVCPSPALIDADAFDDSLRTLLDLPIDHVLVSHGEPVLYDGKRRIAEALSADG